MREANQTAAAEPAPTDPRAHLRTTSSGLADLSVPDNTEPASWAARIKRTLFGNPRDLHDTRLFHQISLVPFLAWVGLGADGLSSSAYGPEEAFRNLGAHTYLAVGAGAGHGFTVFVISAAYRGIIEEFPHGGGGYVVATKLLGRAAGRDVRVARCWSTTS